jgi:hypothetical protein
VLYVVHLRFVVGSDMMKDALGAGGWLVPWLIASPADAWRAILRFQAYLLPQGFQVRSVLMLVVACAATAASKDQDRTPAVLTVCGLGAAVLAAWLGLYPLGEARHSTWLVALTLPTLGWLAGWAMQRDKRAALVSLGVLVLVLAAGGPLERVLGAEPIQPLAAEEQLVRSDSMAPLVVTRLDPAAEPRTILMSQQTYNVLMPLYASAHQEAGTAPDLQHMFSFPYGERTIFVAPQWDWDGGINDVLRLTPFLPGDSAADAGDRTILLLAGGWGSGFFSDLPELAREGAVLGDSRAVGTDSNGRAILRMMAVLLDLDSIAVDGRPDRP